MSNFNQPPGPPGPPGGGYGAPPGGGGYPPPGGGYPPPGGYGAPPPGGYGAPPPGGYGQPPGFGQPQTFGMQPSYTAPVQGSIGLGFAAGFFGGCIGLILVYAIAKGPATKKGAGIGFAAQIVAGGVMRILANA
ncbi:MAG: hypothetical protein KF819_40635 [Labilithrix sp.]|nr:hypothetical protein [Labilithrix sp.]